MGLVILQDRPLLFLVVWGESLRAHEEGARSFLVILLESGEWGYYKHPRSTLRMAKITLILSIVFAIAAAVVGVLNQGKVEQLKGTLADTQKESSTAQSSLAESKKTIEGLEKNIKDLTAQAEQQSSELLKVKSELGAEKSKVIELNETLASKETDLAAATTKAQSQTEEIDQLKERLVELDAVPKKDPGDVERLSSLEEDKDKLQVEVAQLKERINTLQQRDAEKTLKTSLRNLTGRVLAVNQAWNFVVLDIGDKKGVLANTELIVKRGTTGIGRVRITSVEPSSSIADIIPSSLVPGLIIQPGDQVIYTNESL